MNDVMIDLETLGTAPGASILTIGAVRFRTDIVDPVDLSPEDICAGQSHRAFYARIDRASCARIGLTEDAETLAWWDRQSPAARAEAFDAGPRRDIADVMREFAAWCAESPQPWSHGAGFDVVLLEDAFARLGIPRPWKFQDVRDTRTLYAFAGVKPQRDENHHHALFDAVAQARAVCQAFRHRAIFAAANEGFARETYRLRTRVAALEGALTNARSFAQSCRDGYERNDISHVEFRVRVARWAEDQVADFDAALSATPATVNDPLTAGAVKESLTTATPSQSVSDDWIGRQVAQAKAELAAMPQWQQDGIRAEVDRQGGEG